MAITTGLSFLRGRFDNMVLRQTKVSINGRVEKRAVASRYQSSVTNPQTKSQMQNRSAFRMVQALSTVLKIFLRQFFSYSGRFTSGYNGFISVNMLNAVIEISGVKIIDWSKITVTNSNILIGKVGVYAPISPTDDDCLCTKLIVWNYDYADVFNGSEWALMVLGIGYNDDGSLAKPDVIQTSVTMDKCGAQVELPKCECCTMYYYGFFVNVNTGEVTKDFYLGTCECIHPSLPEKNCFVCRLPEDITLDLPSDCPTNCDEDSGSQKVAPNIFTPADPNDPALRTSPFYSAPGDVPVSGDKGGSGIGFRDLVEPDKKKEDNGAPIVVATPSGNSGAPIATS